MKLQSRQQPPEFRSQGWIEDIVWAGSAEYAIGAQYEPNLDLSTTSHSSALAATRQRTAETKESRARYEWLEGYRPLLVAGMSYGEIQVKATSTGGLR